ncbi:SIR2 family protein [Paenibacillus polymyxa]|uniref:SIR2 family protein n=1 Tax=Paenibacillus polymyxa TaxID=1406 RepID=UPI000403BD41|nr:SIR2 family protein [Paenibacillus polymyxa]
MSGNIEKYEEHLKIIKEALEMQNAYLFIGAGFSQNAEPKTVNTETSFKTWPGFMNQLALKLWPNETSDQISSRVAGDHLFIAQLFEEEFGRERFYHELLEAVPYKDYVPSAIHREVMEISDSAKWRGFITTNQDCLIEQTLDELHIFHDVIIDDLDLSTKPSPVKVYKLHGSMESPNSIIFTEEQYRTFENNHPLLHLKIRSIFAENIVVFVGFSLTDTNFKSIVGWVRDILTVNYQKKAYAFIFDKDIDVYTYRYWEKRNIILLPISTAGFLDRGNAYVTGLREYINFFKQSNFQDTNNESTEVIDTIIESIDNLILPGTWEDKKTEELLKILSKFKKYSSDILFNRLVPFFNNIFPDLEASRQLEILLTLYEPSIMFNKINETSLSDLIINLLKNTQEFYDKDFLYKLLADKAEKLFAYGNYDEVKEHVRNSLNSYKDISVSYKNELLYWQICAEKLSFNFNMIKTLLHQIVIDWHNPLWLNRLASIHYFNGDLAIALNYYNRAIESGMQKKDDWNTYTALASKIHLHSNNYSENMKLSRQDEESTIRISNNLRHKLKELDHPTFKQWEKVREIKEQWWTVYKNWKEGLVSESGSFHSFKSEAIYKVYEAIWFHQYNGLPDQSLMGTTFDVITDIFVENNNYEKAASLSLIFGFNKKISALFHYKKISELQDQVYRNIFNQSIMSAKHLIDHCKSQQNSKDLSMLETWIETLLNLWERIFPFLFDKEISEVQGCLYQLKDSITGLGRIFSIRENIIQVMVTCLFYRKDQKILETLIQWIAEMPISFRLIRPLQNVIWNEFRGSKLISSEFLEIVLSVNDIYCCNLIYDWIKEGILEDYQISKVVQHLFIEDRGSIEEKLLLSPLVKEKVDDTLISEIITSGVDKFGKHQSSNDMFLLFYLAKVADKMKEEQINRLIELTEEKIENAQKGKPLSFFTAYSEEEEGITGAFLLLLSNLFLDKKIGMNDVVEKVQKYYKWDRHAYQALEVFAVLDGMKEKIEQQLLSGIQSFNLNTRTEYSYLIGRFMGRVENIDEGNEKLLKHLFFSVFDTSVEVSSEAIRAFAFIASENSSVISKNMLIDIINIVKDTLSRKHVGYLTNLAFFLKEVSKLEKLEDEQAVIVKETINKLKNMPYANVRRELL